MTASASQRETWSSRKGFILAAVGGAVGLGNLWRFPYLAGEHGGGAFVLVYIGFVFLIGLPLMIAEMTMGKRGKGSAVHAVATLVRDENAHPAWKIIGWASIIVPCVGLSYYSVVAAWTLDYFGFVISGGLSQISAATSAEHFNGRIADPLRQTLLHAGFIIGVAVIVGRGVRNGIERASAFMIPALFGILVLIVLYNIATTDIAETVAFLFRPNFADLTSASILVALGQAFFSLAIGVGMMITYAAYLPEDVSLGKSAGVICLSDTIVALLAGLAIFPIVFQAGLSAGEGPGLIFITLPVAFAAMPFGAIVGTVFFLLLFFAAFTTGICMLEPVVSWLIERRNMTRIRAAILSSVAIWALGIGSVLSFGALSDFHPFGFVDAAAGKTIFDVLDFAIANVLLPVNVLLIALFAGWVMSTQTAAADLGGSKSLVFRGWFALVRYVAPVAIVIILADLWL